MSEEMKQRRDLLNKLDRAIMRADLDALRMITIMALIRTAGDEELNKWTEVLKSQ